MNYEDVPIDSIDVNEKPHLSTVIKCYLADGKYIIHHAVTKDEEKNISYDHLRVRRIDNMPIMSWPDMQQIKNDILGKHVVAVQVFPKQEDLIDGSNTYHMFSWNGIEMPSLKKLYQYKEGVLKS